MDRLPVAVLQDLNLHPLVPLACLDPEVPHFPSPPGALEQALPAFPEEVPQEHLGWGAVLDMHCKVLVLHSA